MNRPQRGIFWKNNKWWVDYFDNGKRVTRPASTNRREAEQILIELKNRVLRKKTGLKVFDKMTFAELAKEYMEKHSRPMKRSWKDDSMLLQYHLIPFFGDMMIDEITRRDFDHYRAERIQEKVRGRERMVSQATLNREAALIRSIMNRAVDWGFIESNPLSRLNMFREELRRRILSLAQIRELVDLASQPLKSIILVALNTGMRLGEIRKLKWENVNLDTRFLTVIHTKTNRPREIFINDSLLELFARLEAERDENVFVFQNPNTGGSKKSQKTAWRTLMRKIRLRDFRFHDLRHVWASYAQGDMVT